MPVCAPSAQTETDVSSAEMPVGAQEQVRAPRSVAGSSIATLRFRIALCDSRPVSISGAHVIIYSRDPEADRAFFRDVLDYPHVDAVNGWLIFKMPPAEVAIHPADEPAAHELYFMCNDLDATIAELAANGVSCTAVAEAQWGGLSRFQLPGGSEVSIYQPRHPRATDL